MFLAPYKIFTVSKNKRLFKPSEPNRTIGIYDAIKLNYKDACYYAEKNDAQVSILLGEIPASMGTKLMVLDLDDCYTEDGELEPLTKKFLEEFSEEEWEISTSGTGIHIYILTKLDLDTFIVKDLEGSKSFECYTNKRHIVTTLFDFENTSLFIGKHDSFLEKLYNKVREQKEQNFGLKEQVINVFQGKEINTEQDLNSAVYKRTPVTDMYTLRGIGYKDPMLIEIIDENPDAVDQSAHDAKLIRKLMYYTLSFDAAWEMAKKTNYYKAKDEKHKKKFDDPKYIARTKQFIGRGF